MRNLTWVLMLAMLTQLLACRQSGADGSGPDGTTARDTIPYSIVSLDTTDQACLSKFKNCPNLLYSYPVFAGSDTALNGYLNRLVMEQFRTSFQTPRQVSPADYVSLFFREHREGRQQFQNEDGPTWGWYQQLHIRVIAWKGNYLCLARDWSAYTGGAHDMYGFHYLNVDLVNKQLLQVGDLLDTGDTELKRLGETWFRHDLKVPDSLQLKDAGYFVWDSELAEQNGDGTGFHFNDNFGITDTGITFLYNSYEIAAYASGVPEFTLPYGPLKPFLKKPVAE